MLKFICSFLLLLNVGILKCQTWQWAFSTKELTNTQTVIDSSNNVYVAGYFQGDSCLFNGANISGQQNFNLLLAKLSPGGTTLWTKVCSSSSSIKNVGILEYNGEVILGVNFSGNMSGFINDSSTTQKYFIGKVNASGNLTYYKKEGNANLISMDITLNGSILANGIYNQSTTISGVTLTGNPNINSGFFLRYNKNGTLSLIKNLVWKNSGYLNGIHSDSFNNIYMSGAFEQDSLKIGNDTAVDFTTANFNYARELFRFDSFGQLKKVDITSVYFTNMVDYRAFGNGGYTVRFISTGCNHCVGGLIISRADNQNNDTWSYLYGKGYSSGAPNQPPAQFMYPGAINGDSSNIYFAGIYSAKQTIGSDTIYNAGMVLAKMNHAGVYEKVVSAEHALSPSNLSNIKNNSVIVSGINGSGGFLGAHQLDSLGQKGGFIAKWGEPVPVLVKEHLKPLASFEVYPNPSSGMFVIEPNGIGTILSYKVFNGMGKVVSTKAITTSQKIELQLNDQPKGIYLLEIDNGREKFHKKLILD